MAGQQMTSPSDLLNSRVRKQLHQWLKTTLPPEEGDRLAYHLADLHAAFLNSARQLELIAELSANSPPAEIRRLLSGLAGELYDHIPTHLEGAREDLQPWITRLYEEAEESGDL